MAGNSKLIISNAREFIKKLDKHARAMQKAAMIGFGNWMINAKKSSVDFMAPNRYSGESFNITRMGEPRAFIRRKTFRGGKAIQPLSAVQRSNPTKTTVRTGLLSKIVMSGGDWQANTSGTVARFRGSGQYGQHTIGWIRPQWIGGKMSYHARMSIVEKGIDFIRFRLDNETGKGGGRGRRKPARPFINPSLQASGSKFESTLMKELSGLVNATL